MNENKLQNFHKRLRLDPVIFQALMELQESVDRLNTIVDKNFSSNNLKATCIYCGKTYTDSVEVEYLQHNIRCLGCENILTDIEGDLRG